MRNICLFGAYSTKAYKFRSQGNGNLCKFYLRHVNHIVRPERVVWNGTSWETIREKKIVPGFDDFFLFMAEKLLVERVSEYEFVFSTGSSSIKFIVIARNSHELTEQLNTLKNVLTFNNKI